MKKILKILINLFTLKSATLQGSIACFDSTANESKQTLDKFDYVISDEDATKLNYDMLITKIKHKLVEVSKPQDNNLEIAKIDDLITNGKLAITILKEDDSVLNKDEFNHYYGTFKIKVETLKDNDYFTSKSEKIVANLKKIYSLDLSKITFDVSKLNTLNTNQEIITNLKETIDDYFKTEEINNNNFNYAISFVDSEDNPVVTATNKTLNFQIIANDKKLQFVNNVSKIPVSVSKYDLADLNLEPLVLDYISINTQDNFEELIIDYLNTKLQQRFSIANNYFSKSTAELSNTEDFSLGTKTITFRALADNLYFQNQGELQVEINRHSLALNNSDLVNDIDDITSFNSKANLVKQVKDKIVSWYRTSTDVFESDSISEDDISLEFNFENNKLNVDYQIDANNYFEATSGSFVLNNAKISTESLNFEQEFWTVDKILTTYDGINVQWLKQEAKNHFVNGIITTLGFKQQVSNDLKEAIKNSLNNIQVLNPDQTELIEPNQELDVRQYKVAFRLQNNNYLVDNNHNLFFNIDWDSNLKTDLHNLQFAQNQLSVLKLSEIIANFANSLPTKKVSQLIKDEKLIINFFDENDNVVVISPDSADRGNLTMNIQIKPNRYFQATPQQTPIVKSDLQVYTKRLDLGNMHFRSENLNPFFTDEEIISELKSQLISYSEDIDLFSNTNINKDNTEFNIEITGTDINQDPTIKKVNFEITTTNANLALENNTARWIKINKINLANLRIPKLNLNFANNRDLATIQRNVANHVLQHIQQDYSNFNLEHLNSLSRNLHLPEDIIPISVDATFRAGNDNSYFYNDLDNDLNNYLEFKIRIHKLEATDLNWDQLNLDTITSFNSVADLKTEIQRIISEFYLTKTESYQPNLINQEQVKITGFNIINNKLYVDYKILSNTFVDKIQRSLVLNNAQVNLRTFPFAETMDVKWASNEPLSVQSYSIILNAIKEQMATSIINADNFNFDFNPTQKTEFKNMLINSFSDSVVHFQANSDISGLEDLNYHLSQIPNPASQEPTINVNIIHDDNLKADLSSFNLNLNTSKSLDYQLVWSEIRKSLIAHSLENNKINDQELENLIPKLLRIQILVNGNVISNIEEFNNYYGEFQIKIQTLRDNRYFKSEKIITLDKPLLFDVDNTINWESLNISALDSSEDVRLKIKEGLRQYLITNYPDYNFDFDVVISQEPTINPRDKVFNFQLTTSDPKLRFISNDLSITVAKINLEDIVIDAQSETVNKKPEDGDIQEMRNKIKPLLLGKIQEIYPDVNSEHLQNLDITLSLRSKVENRAEYRATNKYIVTINFPEQNLYFYCPDKEFNYDLSYKEHWW